MNLIKRYFLKLLKYEIEDVVEKELDQNLKKISRAILNSLSQDESDYLLKRVKNTPP